MVLSSSFPLDQMGFRRIVRLRQRSMKRNVGRFLVKMSVSWSMKETNLITKSLQRTRSRLKWKLTSMCFVWAWNIGFDAMVRAETLSHHRIRGWDKWILRSLSKVRIQHTSTEAVASAQYSDSVEDRDIVDCFLADRVMGLEPR